MTPSAFASWLDAYGRAWTSRDPQAAADLFAEHGTYQVTPFVEPMRGKQAILEYWTNVAQTEQNIQFGYEILALTPEQGIARWWASFVIVPRLSLRACRPQGQRARPALQRHHNHRRKVHQRLHQRQGRPTRILDHLVRLLR